MFGKGKMKSSNDAFVMGAGKAAGNIPKAKPHKDAAHPIKHMKGAGAKPRPRKP